MAHVIASLSLPPEIESTIGAPRSISTLMRSVMFRFIVGCVSFMRNTLYFQIVSAITLLQNMPGGQLSRPARVGCGVYFVRVKLCFFAQCSHQKAARLFFRRLYLPWMSFAMASSVIEPWLFTTMFSMYLSTG